MNFGLWILFGSFALLCIFGLLDFIGYKISNMPYQHKRTVLMYDDKTQSYRIFKKEL